MVLILICMDSEILWYTALQTLSSASPLHVYFTYFNCEFPFLSVSHIPFVANFSRGFQAYYD